MQDKRWHLSPPHAPSPLSTDTFFVKCNQCGNIFSNDRNLKKHKRLYVKGWHLSPPHTPCPLSTGKKYVSSNVTNVERSSQKLETKIHTREQKKLELCRGGNLWMIDSGMCQLCDPFVAYFWMDWLGNGTGKCEECIIVETSSQTSKA